MIQRIKCCEKCREILRDAGYQVTVVSSTTASDVCDVCGLRTGVDGTEIRKGKEAAVCTGLQ